MQQSRLILNKFYFYY